MRALVIIFLAFIFSSCANSEPEPKNDLDSRLRGSWEGEVVSRNNPNTAQYVNQSGVMHRLHFAGEGKLNIETLYDGVIPYNYEINQDTVLLTSDKEQVTFVYYQSEFPLSFRILGNDQNLILHLLPID